jgi:hypothetical protein
LLPQPPRSRRDLGNEDETFHIVEGQLDFLLRDETVSGRPGTSSTSRGTVHGFHNSGTAAAKMILTFSPTNIEHFFAESARPHAGRGRQPRRGGGPLRRRRPALRDGFLD